MLNSEDPTRHFKCHKCHRIVDRNREPMMQFSGGTQCYGLQPSFYSYCLDCWIIVSNENVNRIGGISGREFASVVTERMNQT